MPGVTAPNGSWTPPEDYFNTVMLGLNPEEHNWSNFGGMHWQLVLCLLAAWIIVCLALIKGVQSSGKVVYFTALFPFVVLFIMFVVGLTLPGYEKGIEFYVKPNYTRLGEVEVWQSAATQIFYSLGPTFGGLITLSSYNKFSNNCHRDAFLIAFSNCATSVFAGFVVFSIMGFMAEITGLKVEEVIQSGPSLAFVAYPDAISRLAEQWGPWAPPLMSFLFFFMLLTLGLDSMFTFVETLTTAILDHFRALRRFKEWVVAFTCFMGFICGLVFCTSGGVYMFTLIDNMSASWNILLFALIEVVLVSWLYGADRLFDNIKEMEIRMPIVLKWYWKICWQFVTPITLITLIFFYFRFHEPVAYGKYTFEPPVQGLGWLLGVSTFLLIPTVGAWNLYKRLRKGKPLGWAILRPTPKWRPHDGQPTGTSMDKLDEIN